MLVVPERIIKQRSGDDLNVVTTTDSKPAHVEEDTCSETSKLSAFHDAETDSDTELPPVKEWPHRPILLQASPHTRVPVAEDCGYCPLGIPFEFESDLFVGKILVRIKDIKSSDDVVGDNAYFRGRSRRHRAVVQGRFKRVVSVADVMTGHEFERPLKMLPPKWIMTAGSRLIRRLAPGAVMDFYSEKPSMLSSLAGTSQTVTASVPGREPDMDRNDLEEDCSFFGGKLANGLSPSQRKRLLSDPKAASQYVFDTKTVYTFDFYQHVLDISSYSMDLGFVKLNIAPSLDNQPIQVMAKTMDGSYLWNFKIWHEDLIREAK